MKKYSLLIVDCQNPFSKKARNNPVYFDGLKNARQYALNNYNIKLHYSHNMKAFYGFNPETNKDCIVQEIKKH